MLKRITPPVALFDKDQLKAALRLSHDDHDTLIVDLIAQATAYLDGHSGIIGQALVSQAWTQTFVSFSAMMRLDLGPLISVDSVMYFDSNNVEQTLDGASYYALWDAKGPYIKPHHGMSFPSIYPRDDAVTVTMTVGFGEASDVPANLVAAVKMVACHLYENPEAATEDKLSQVPIGVMDLIATHKRYL